MSIVCKAIKFDETPESVVAVGAGVSQSSLNRYCKGERDIAADTLLKVCEFLELELVRRVNLDDYCEAIWQENSDDWWKDYESDAWKEYEGDAWKEYESDAWKEYEGDAWREALEEIEREADSVPTDPDEYEEWSAVEYEEWAKTEYEEWAKTEYEEWKTATRSDLWAEQYSQLSSQDWVILAPGNYVP